MSIDQGLALLGILVALGLAGLGGLVRIVTLVTQIRDDIAGVVEDVRNERDRVTRLEQWVYGADRAAHYRPNPTATAGD